MATAQLHAPTQAAGRERVSFRRRFGGVALAALTAAVGLSGCGFTEFVTNDKGAVASTAESASLPSDPALNGDLLYKLLVGEFASHRGDLLLALENYLEVAGVTGDPEVAARATKLAVFAHAEERALEAARMWIEGDPSSTEGRRVLASPAHSGR